MTEFVEGWCLGHILGEGAYGEVQLVINKATGEAVAMKQIDLRKHPHAKQSVRKETAIHRMLSNPNIIRIFGTRSTPDKEYIFLEYAAGGELFDRIEPDKGMSMVEAQRYFRQLISAVEYLHSRGVVHRDLKPENLLLDEYDNLKVTDFGLATIYRIQGKERRLEKTCGTLPYVAPEVLNRSYYGEPADIWSCGVILVALLAGELPWDKASAECQEYIAWRQGKYMNITPWRKLDNVLLSLIRKILAHEPAERYKIKDIKQHRWVLKRLQRDVYADGGSELKRAHLDEEDPLRFCQSQPELPQKSGITSAAIALEEQTGISFSQPAHVQDLLLCTQLHAIHQTQPSQQNTFQRLVKRMTRFFVKTECEATVKKLIECLENKSYTCRINDGRIITVSTVDQRKMPLVFKANVIEMDGKILLDFRLSKGCGLEFKRRFLRIRSMFDEHILKGPITWPTATKSLS